MFKNFDIAEVLKDEKRRSSNAEEQVVSEVRRILHEDLFSQSKILENLGRYEKRNERLDEDQLDADSLFTLAQLRKIATRHRLRLLPASMYKPEIPAEAVLRISSLNAKHKRELRHFYILSYAGAFESRQSDDAALLFSLTNSDNYYLVHRWGRRVPWHRQLVYWPLRRFETLLLTVVAFTLLLTLSLPTGLITLDSKATYWSGYRAAAFMHLLIFNAGITTYITLTFTRNFSSSVWNRKRDFD